MTLQDTGTATRATSDARSDEDAAERCDVVIVGARLAGACAATHFAKAGRSVVVLDRSRFPSDQLSTHLLFPSGIHELERVGALDRILAHDPARSYWLSLQVPDGEVELVERWRPSGPIDYCLCVPRPIQDLELVHTARAAGADVREKHRMIDVIWRGGRAAGVRYADADGNEHVLHAKLVIGADGRRSAVAGAVGAFEPYRSSRNGRGLVFRYADDPMVDTRDGQTLFQWRDEDSFAMVFPSAPRGRALLLFMGPRDEAARAKDDPDGYWVAKLAQHPGMARRVAGMTELTGLRSTSETSSYFRASSGPGWALIGDAGHFKDPVIAQGQRDALWTGRAVAESTAALLDDPWATDLALRRWEDERDRECVHAYHLGNIETETRPVSPVLTEIFRQAARSETADASDLFGRARSLPQVVSLPRMATGLIAALRRTADGYGRTELLRGALEELTVHLRVRADLWRPRFRSTRAVVGAEWPEARPPTYRPSLNRSGKVAA